jgi:type I restriction enzyme M protein
MSNPQQLVQKLWNYCNILRDDGLSYGDYVEQLTCLLFLKMADEQAKPPFNKPSPIVVPTRNVVELERLLRPMDGSVESEGLALANSRRAAHLRQCVLPMAFSGQSYTRSDGQPLSNQW